MRILSVVIVLALVGCSPAVVIPPSTDSAAPSAAREPDRSAAPTPLFIPSIASSGTPTPAPTSTPLPATSSPMCRVDPAAPPGVYCLTTVYGDVDGDGRPDRAVIWGEGPEPPPFGSSWELAVVLATGAIVRTTVATSDVAALRGIADVNHDGHGLIFFHESHGASTEFWRAAAVIDGQLRIVQEGDHALRIAMYGSVAHGGRFTCVTDARGVPLLSVVAFAARTATLPWVYDWTATNYRIAGARAIAVGTATGSFSETEMRDPASTFNRTWPSPWDPAHPGQCGLRVA